MLKFSRHFATLSKRNRTRNKFIHKKHQPSTAKKREQFDQFDKLSAAGALVGFTYGAASEFPVSSNGMDIVDFAYVIKISLCTAVGFAWPLSLPLGIALVMKKSTAGGK